MPMQTPEVGPVSTRSSTRRPGRPRAAGFAEPGELIAIAAGMPFGVAGTTNLLRIAACLEAQHDLDRTHPRPRDLRQSRQPDRRGRHRAGRRRPRPGGGTVRRVDRHAGGGRAARRRQDAARRQGRPQRGGRRERRDRRGAARPRCARPAAASTGAWSRSTAREQGRASAPTPSWASASPWPRRRPPPRACRCGATSAGPAPACCRCR